MTYDPVNYRKRDLVEMDRDLEYAFKSLDVARAAIEKCNKPFCDVRMLELGPGVNFGSQLLLASEGVQITLSDRFLARWDEHYHPAFYARLLETYQGSAGEVAKVLEAGNHGASSIRLLEEPAEELASVASGSMDVVFSCAVLEHIYDLQAVAEELARITAVGGINVHIIDHRYHRDFKRPLEHIIWDDRQFRVAAETVDYEFGNGWRPMEFWAEFERHHLMVIKRDTTEFIKPDYAAEAYDRLREGHSSYRRWPQRDLEKIGTQFLLRRVAGREAEVLADRALDVLALIESLKESSRELAILQPRPTDNFREILISQLPVGPDEGFSWICPLKDYGLSDCPEHPYRSTLEIYEDGSLLGPPHTSHQDIRSRGTGRFSHWEESIYFSTSDNSSPLINGRTYVARIREP